MKSFCFFFFRKEDSSFIFFIKIHNTL